MVNLFNMKNGQYHQGSVTYDASPLLIEDPTFDPDLATIQAALPKYLKNTAGTITVMDAAAQTVVDDSEEYLDPEKARRCEAVDQQSEVLRAAGYEYPATSGNLHPLSRDAQDELQEIIELNSFPVVVSMLNEKAYSIVDAADAASMRTAQLTRLYDGIRTPGSTLKNNLSVAADRAAVDAIIDTRT